ncbi:MAG: hypothetical protein M1282_13255 [Chloroflexi bacterium]|nr:hypothetical protein [Chloroflexota bacterium]
MAMIYQFLSTYEVLIYIVLAIGALFAFRWLWRSWNEWREAVYSLEKEFALRRMGQSIAFVTLIMVLFCGEFIAASFIIPGLPASFFIATPTLDLFATPTGTISAELATQIALTPRPVATLSGTSGCVADKLIITDPKSGTQISGKITLRGTVNVPNLGFYKYEVAPLNSTTWATISAGRSEVVNGPLGDWDTSTLTPGDYQLRLVATDNQGNALPPCIIQIRVGGQ